MDYKRSYGTMFGKLYLTMKLSQRIFLLNYLENLSDPCAFAVLLTVSSAISDYVVTFQLSLMTKLLNLLYILTTDEKSG